MSKVELREKFAASTVAGEAPGAESVDTPPVIRELKNYHPFSGAKSFRLSRIRRDSFVAEHRSIGVFTSGGDASGIVSTAHNIYILRLCYDVSVRLSNFGFKFRSQFTTHCGRCACGCEGRDHHREECRDHLALCWPLLGAFVDVVRTIHKKTGPD